MCSSEQYKDYMMTVCPVTCEFCKENHVRDEIEEPEDTSMSLFEASEEEGASEADEPDSESGSGSGNTEESGSGTDETSEKKESTPAEESDEGESGQSEESKEDDEAPDNEQEEKEDAKPVQPVKQVKQANKNNKGGEISVLLRQGFKTDFKNKDSAPYRMLSGNVIHDFEKALDVEVTDVSFSEGSMEGNPRQTGKTKMTFSINGNDQKLLKKLTKMVNKDQSINGLSVYAGTLEYDE